MYISIKRLLVSFPVLVSRISIIVVFWAFLAPGIAFPQVKKTYTLAILDLVPNGISQVEAIGLSDKLRIHISRLIKSPEYIKSKGKEWYTVVERAQMEKILDQYNVQNACVSDSCAVEFGKILQVDRIIIGTTSLIGKTYSVTSRIVDVETAKTLAEADRQYKGSIDNVLNKVIMQVGDELFLIKRKTHTKLYFTAGAIVAGAAVYALTSEKKSATSTKPGTLIFNNSDLPDEP